MHKRMLLEKGCQISNLHSFPSFFSLYLFLKHQMHFTTRKRKKFWKFAFSYACESTVRRTYLYERINFTTKLFSFFFFCRVALGIFECTMVSKVNRCGDDFCPPMVLMCAVPISHLMLVLSSSVNIIIYCVLGDGFRFVIFC